MQETKINLEDLYYKSKGSNVNISKAQFKNAILEFSKQLLELAAENVKLIHSENLPNEIDRAEAHYDFMEKFYLYIDKQSILNTIKQIE